MASETSTSTGITALIHARLGTTYCGVRIKFLRRPQVFIQTDAAIAPRDICTGSINKIAGYHANLACSGTRAEGTATGTSDAHADNPRQRFNPASGERCGSRLASAAN